MIFIHTDIFLLSTRLLPTDLLVFNHLLYIYKFESNTRMSTRRSQRGSEEDTSNIKGMLATISEKLDTIGDSLQQIKPAD